MAAGNDHRFLIDECLSPVLAVAARDRGHYAVHVTRLGLAGASDQSLFDHAGDRTLVIVTANGRDFRRLCATRGFHHGLVVLATTRVARHAALFSLALDHLESLGDARNLLIEVGGMGQVRARPFPLPPAE
jgi:predicted nuclease of predicted toxin-antitoxin system